MPTIQANGIGLAYELTGTGEAPIVFVHGSWGSHHAFDLVTPKLAERFRVVTYDRRGHSDSERPPGQGSVHEDVADLAALIEGLDLAPAWVAGTSYGAIITLRLAGERPELFRGLIAHEPPLLALPNAGASKDPNAEKTNDTIRSVVARIDAGDHEGAAEQFVDSIAFGPGTWAHFPEPLRLTFTFNAPTWSDEQKDPESLTMDLDRLRRFDHPALITIGDHSPPWFAPIARTVVEYLPNVELLTFPGAGHGPHSSHPGPYVEAITAFIDKASA